MTKRRARRLKELRKKATWAITHLVKPEAWPVGEKERQAHLALLRKERRASSLAARRTMKAFGRQLAHKPRARDIEIATRARAELARLGAKRVRILVSARKRRAWWAALARVQAWESLGPGWRPVIEPTP